jgi:serine/threonine protein kinase
MQFLAELRVYTTLSRHRNICAFLGCLEGLGLVLEYIDGYTLYDAIRSPPRPLTHERKVDYHNQLLAGLMHLHTHRLSHGDLSLTNVYITHAGEAIRLFDFGRSVSADSIFRSPDDEPVDPFAHLHAALTNSQDLRPPRRHAFSAPTSGPGHANLGGTLPAAPAEPQPQVEQIHPGTRPFAAPEVLRGECTDPLLADAYSFGMVLVCLDREESVDVKPWDQRKDLLPKGFLDRCVLFGASAAEYLRKFDSRRRLKSADEMVLS